MEQEGVTHSPGQDANKNDAGTIGRKLGFQTSQAFRGWVAVTACMTLVVSARVPLAVPGALEKTLPPGEWFSHSEKQAPIIIHVIVIFVWTVLGIFQFVPKIRRRFPSYHRIGGRVYLACVLVILVSGLWMAPYAFGGGLNAIAATWVLGFAFAFTAGMGVRRALQRHLKEHRQWMLRNYACGTSVLWSRILVPGLGLSVVRYLNLWSVMPCNQVLYELREEPELVKEHFPMCLDGKHTLVSTNGPTMVSVIAAMRIAYSVGLWVGLIVNMVCIEMWLQYTAREPSTVHAWSDPDVRSI